MLVTVVFSIQDFHKLKSLFFEHLQRNTNKGEYANINI